MTDLRRLREHLGAAGIADGAGEFSIDAARARDKLRDFQLADPRLYVALVVQAATLAGAGRIDFTLDSDDLIAAFDGHPFAADDLADLYAHVFRDPTTPTQRALQRLALALNGAMALRPRYVRLTAVGPDGGVELTLRPDRPDQLEPLPPGPPRTRLHVKEPPRAGRISAYMTSVLDEARLLRRTCAFARLVVTLDGAPLSSPLADVPLLHPSALVGRRGVAGLLGGKTYPFDDLSAPAPESAVVDVLLHGVHLTRVVLGGFPSELRAIVDGDDLRDDLSLGAVVADDAYVAALAAALAAADRSVAARLRAARGRDDVRHASRLVERFLLARGADPPGDSAALAAFRALPRWSTLDGKRRSADDLHQDDPPILVAEAMAWTVKPAEAARIVLVDAHERRLADAVFGARVRDVTPGLARLEARAANERAWRSRPRAPSLALADAVLRVRVRERGLVGELAVRPGAAGPSHLTLVLDGCAFASVDLPLPLEGVSAVFEGDFVPSDLFDRVDPCPALAGLAVLLLRHLDALVQAVAGVYDSDPAWQRYLPRDALLAYAAALARGDALVAILRTFGFTPQDATHLEPFADLPPPTLALDPQGAPALARLRLVDTPTGLTSLVDLARLRAERGRLPVLARGLPHTIDEPCALVDGRARALLAAIFGDDLEDMSHAIAKSRGRRRFLTRPQVALELPQAVVEARVDDGDLAVLAGLAPALLGRARRLALHVRVQRRHLATLDVDIDLPGVVAVADDSTFEIADEELTGLTDGPRRAHLLRTAAAALAALVGAALDLPADERPPGAAALLAAALALVFGDAGRRRLDDHTRAIAPELADERLRSTLREEARGGWSDAATLTGRLRLLLLDHLARLREARVFPTLRGDHLSLDDLVAGAAADRPGAPLLHAPLAPATYPDLPERPAILSVALSQHPVLHALFDDAQSELDRDAVERRCRAHQERRRPPPVDALVRVDVRAGLHGFIGLAPDPGAAALIVCERDGWLVGVATIHAPLPLVGRLAGDLHADLHAPGRPLDVTSEDRVEVAARAHLPGLLLALADAWEAAPNPALGAWILEVLARVDGDDPTAAPGLSAALARLAELPLFPTRSGLPRSYRELRTLHDEVGDLAYARLGDPPGHSEFPILAADPADPSALPRLRALFPRLRPFEAARPADGPPALPSAPADALARAPLALGDLRGELWLGPPGEPDLWVTLHLGHGGRELAVVAEPHPLPATLALFLSSPDDRLDAPRRAALLDAVDALHADLVAAYVAALDQALADPDPAPIDARLRRHLAADPPALRAYLLDLHRALDALHRTAVPLPPGVDAVRRALLAARIVELPSGRLVRPGLAAEPRPAPPRRPHAPPAAPDPAPAPRPALAAPPSALDPASAAPPSALDPASAAPPPPSPAALLVGAVRSELQRVRDGVTGVVDEAMLETLEIADAPGVAALVDGRVVLGRGHPLVVRALADHDRAAVLVSFLASAVYTALNAHHEAITDHHEAEFHRAHAAHLLGA